MATIVYREQMQATILAGKILLGMALCFCFVLLSLNLAGMVERLMKVGWSGILKTSIRRSFAALFMFCFLGTITVAIHTAMLFYDFTQAGGAESCLHIVGALCGIFVTGKQFLFMFLYFRAKIVHEALRLNGFKLVWLRRFIWSTVTLGIPVAFGWTYFLELFGKVVPEGACVMYSADEIGIIAFGVCDLIFSFVLLILFVEPLRQHSKRISVHDGKLEKVIRRNLIVGVLVMVSTLGALVALAVILTTVHGKDVSPDMEYLQILASLLPMMDLTFTLATAHMLTRAWMPTKVWHYLHVTSEDHVTSKVLDSKGTSPSSATNAPHSPERLRTLPSTSVVVQPAISEPPVA